jgi:hypothetical protein
MRSLTGTRALFLELATVSLVGLIGCGTSPDPSPSYGYGGAGGRSGFGGSGPGGSAGSGQFGAGGLAGRGQLGAGGQGGQVGMAGQDGGQVGASGQAGSGQVGASGQAGSGQVGASGQAGSGQVGAAGSAGSGASPDGCTDRLVTGLSLSAVDAYQTVQIRIMKGGTAVGQRNADVVVGRKTVFRVHVTPDAGWTPRQVSARIELTNVEMPDPTQKKTFFGLLTPSTASSDADLKSTFQVNVPAEAIGPDTRYAVTLVECGGGATGSPATGARFPSAGFEDLAARTTGPLKVHIIPISGTNVTTEGLKPFKERVEAVYPITQVEFTIAAPLTATAASMCALLSSVTSRRSQDRPANDVYYYGLAPGILGGQSGCSTTSTSPTGGKVSAGWAQGYTPDDGRTGAATMCHELGHAHGRYHAPCNVQDPDARYPHAGANIGVWGYDQRSGQFLQPTSKDMMSYCPEPRWSAWISDYTYQGIVERAAVVNGQPEEPASFDASATLVSWRLLVSDSAGVHWAAEPLLVRGTPDGDPMSAVIHGEKGPVAQVVVYRQRLEDGVSDRAFMLTLPEPDPSWRAIEVPGLLPPQPL